MMARKREDSICVQQLRGKPYWYPHILELAATTSQVFWQGTHCKSDKLLRAKGTRGL